MEVYVKESVFVLDYKDNIVDTIFTSDDHITPGYAYNINIVEANTGYSDLKFDMPNTIITDDASKIKNPKLALLKPLVKLRYRREVYFAGDRPITVREPIGYGDTVTYKDVVYDSEYPNNLIEDYVMDYVVQPVDKKRDVLQLTTSFTAIDYPRFTLSKKKVGMAISTETLTKREWTLFENKPMSVAGKIKYTKWERHFSDMYKMPNQFIPTEWDPKSAVEYPLNKDNIIKMMAADNIWTYGMLATAFYWPITSTGRFKGKMYKKGGFLVLRLFDFMDGSKKGIDPSKSVDRYSWDWSQLYEIQPYLCPNNARNYLHHILEGTNWTVAKREDGTDDVDIVRHSIPNPKGSTKSKEMVDLTCNLSLSGSNCYNAITSLCQGTQVYPVFDCINRTVALRIFAGKNYGLSYSLGNNLTSNGVRLDGEKVVTKLYVTGGKDYKGNTDINIGRAVREHVKTFAGFYKNEATLPTENVEGYWAIVDDTFTNDQLQTVKYDRAMKPYTKEAHGLDVANFWISGPNRKVYFYNPTTHRWGLGTKNTSGNWSGVVDGKEYTIDPTTGTEAPWDPNDKIYISSRSPYGTNYIVNLKWAYQNKWITKEQILELYQLNKKINDLDYMFMEGYTQDRLATQNAYHEAVNNYDIQQDTFESTLQHMENKYYLDEAKPSEGAVYCFHKAPQGTYTAFDPKKGKTVHFIKMFHCYACGKTEYVKPGAAEKTVCSCGSSDVVNNPIYIPTYADFNLKTTKSLYPYGTNVTQYDGPQYNPQFKGNYQRLVMTLDKQKNDWTIEDYEKVISMIEPIKYKEGEGAADGYTYVVGYNNGGKPTEIYIRSASGQIENWNKYIDTCRTSYGKMLDYLRQVNDTLERIEDLKVLFDKWQKVRDGYHTEIQQKFGDYLVEGNYKNNEQPYEGLLFKEGLEASDKFCIPEVTYNLDVIASSGLVEYRTPTITTYECGDCGYTSHYYMEECPKCSSRVILRNQDSYNDLVHMLHNIGQIVPKPGDYVAIYDEPMGMFGVPGLITEISRKLDDPCKNTITLNTSYTDDEELVGNIINATNTVLNNADIYARTAVLKGDGTIAASTIKESLDNSNANISIVGTNGNVLLDGSGLRASDPSAPANAMKYAGNGIFKTNNLESKTGEPVVWEKMIGPEGINATHIKAGSLDTNKVTILSGLSGKVMIDQYGLTVKNETNKAYHLTDFDIDKAKKDASYAVNWGIENNIAAFNGVLPVSNKPLLYTRGFLAAEEGSNIANWITSREGLYHLNGSQKDLWLSPVGISGTVNDINEKFAIYANGKFGVTTGGRLLARDVNIQGTIDAHDGKIGGFTLNQQRLYSGSGTQMAGLGVYGSGYAFWAGSTDSYSAPFRVGHDGSLFASNADITGSINTTNLNASGHVSINDARINNATITHANVQYGKIGYAQLDNCNVRGEDIRRGVVGIDHIPEITADKINAQTLETVIGEADYFHVKSKLSIGNQKGQEGKFYIFSGNNRLLKMDPSDTTKDPTTGRPVSTPICLFWGATIAVQRDTASTRANGGGWSVGVTGAIKYVESASGGSTSSVSTDTEYLIFLKGILVGVKKQPPAWMKEVKEMLSDNGGKK